MKDLYVKYGKLAKDKAEIEVFVRSSWQKGELAFKRHIVRLENEKGHLKVQTQEAEEEGFLCAECNAATMADREDGSWYYSKGKGLCAACASTETIFNKWVANRDTKGAIVSRATEYIWKGA